MTHHIQHKTSTMRELDTETPVVWPAWCYQSGESIHSYLISCRKCFFSHLFVLLNIRLLRATTAACTMNYWLLISYHKTSLSPFFPQPLFSLHHVSYVAFDLNSFLMSLCHRHDYHQLKYISRLIQNTC